MLAAPEAHQFACLDKSTTRLLPVRCELWRGLVFINLDPDAAPLAEFMAPALTYTQGFPLEDLVLHGHFIIEFDCNWKLAYQNFRSEERRVGKEWVSTCRSRGLPAY